MKEKFSSSEYLMSVLDLGASRKKILAIRGEKMKKNLALFFCFMLVFCLTNIFGMSNDDYVLSPSLRGKTLYPDYIVSIDIQTEAGSIHSITGIEKTLFKKDKDKIKNEVKDIIYTKIDKIPAGLATGTLIGIVMTPQNFIFNYELIEKPIPEKLVVDFGPEIKIFSLPKGPIPIPAANVKIVKLENANMDCSLKVKIYGSPLDLLKDKEGAIVFSTNLTTIKLRPRWGLQAGILFAFVEMNSYRLEYNNVALKEDKSNIEETYPIIRNDKITPLQNIKPVIFITYLFSRKYDLHFNVGTEIGQSILKTWIAGVGHRIGNISFNLFLKWFKYDILTAEGYEVDGVINNPNVEAVPVSKKSRMAICFSISTPINIFTGFVGKIFGI
jgi:hypothetical protein